MKNWIVVTPHPNHLLAMLGDVIISNRRNRMACLATAKTIRDNGMDYYKSLVAK